MSIDPDMWDASRMTQYAAQGLTTEVVMVGARNAGRMPVSVEQITLKLENGIAFIPPLGVGGNPPVLLSARGGKLADLVRARRGPPSRDEGVRIGKHHHPFRGRVGNGKTVETKPIAFS